MTTPTDQGGGEPKAPKPDPDKDPRKPATRQQQAQEQGEKKTSPSELPRKQMEARPSSAAAKKPAVPEPAGPKRFVLSSSPHIRTTESVTRIMYTVTLTLLPATLGATWIFGLRALLLVLIGGAAAVLAEWGLQRLFRLPSTVADGSALLTGVLVSFNLPPGVPWWLPVMGSLFAIGVGKLPFGGLGYNPMNPALLGRAFLLASWPVHMTKDWLQPFWWKQEGFSFFTWKVPLVGPDAVTTATPLEVKKTALGTISEKANLDASIVNQAFDTLDQVSGKLMSLLVGTVGGCIGETSAILLLVGAVYLLYKNYIDWRVPFSFIGVVALGGWLFGGPENLFGGDPLFHIFAGGLILGAFYMATDMVTTPLTAKGRLIFGAGAGLLTLMIRLIGGYPEGVSYAILLMNLTTPLIDRYTVPRRFGNEPKQSGGEGER